jgi:thiol-disulfide isomerase/thioredoxin
MSISLKPNKFLELNLTGSRTQADYEQWRDEKAVMRQPYQKELNLLSDPEYGFKRDSLFAILQPLNEAIRKKDLEFFSKHPQSVATLYFLQYYTRKLSPDSLTRYYSGLGYKLQNTFIGKKIFESISKRSGVVGTLAKSFVTQDINGAIVLSEFFKGKYVLLDFWATWCVPCREGNPHLIKLFAKHKSKNFAIISIADDRDTVAWKKAIEKDGTGLWTHVLRGANPTLKYNGVADPNDLNDKFGVEVLPTMLLLDKTGLIIGRYKGSEEIIELEKKLEEIFKSPA